MTGKIVNDRKVSVKFKFLSLLTFVTIIAVFRAVSFITTGRLKTSTSVHKLRMSKQILYPYPFPNPLSLCPYPFIAIPLSLSLYPFIPLSLSLSLYPYLFIPIPLSISLYPYPFIPIPLSLSLYL